MASGKGEPMRTRSSAAALTAGVLVSLIGMVLTAPPPAVAAGRLTQATCTSRVPGQPPSPGQDANLEGVAVLSACDVWVVGWSARGPLIEQWNGRGWKVLASPGPRSGSFCGVSAVSPASVWAVGRYTAGAVTRALIAHWDGIRWRQAAVPALSGTNTALTGVAAVSNRDVWAVGFAQDKTLILHWNGARWARVGYRSPGAISELDGVSASGPGSVWAVGSYSTATTQRSLIVRWTGAKWISVPSPRPGSGSELAGVSVVSPSLAWAAGDDSTTQFNPFAVRWNGTSWRQAPPLPQLRLTGFNSILTGVAVVSGRDVWVVGTDLDPFAGRWNGSAWQIFDPGVPGTYNAVAADRAGDAWAVGNYDDGSPHTQAYATRLR
jgi:hypothetical protein